MSDLIDRPRAVLAGEELDAGALARFLAEHVARIEADADVEVEQFPGGYSNLTYLVRAGGREMVLRRPPFGAAIRSAHDMGREHRILSHLGAVYPRVPRALAYCDDPAVLGAPFYVMERVRGVILRGRPGEPELPADAMRGLSQALVSNLAELHAVDVEAAGLGDLGHADGYVERQVRGWTERYLRARTDDVPAIEAAARWLAENRPGESGAALIHNDYKYDNLVLDPGDLTRIVAVLDWEMATVGDPWMDVGTSLAYWLDPDDPPALRQMGLNTLSLRPGNLRRSELVHAYAEASGRPAPDPVFYFVYGLLKVATIAQQIYARFVAGHTKDPRFGALIHAVRALGTTAELAMERGRIDGLG
jgi:aminoglycoside phosphotransferase (APT) family kinase protein